MVGDEVVQIQHFGLQPVLQLMCEQVRCPGETALCDATFLVSSTSMLPELCDLISVVG